MNARRLLGGWIVLLVVSAGAGAWLWAVDARSGDVDAARIAGVAAARAQVVEVLSYDYQTVESDLDRAAATLTGPFRGEFAAQTKELVVPAAKAKNISTKVEVTQAGAVAGDADEVTVLLFVTQTTTSKGQAAPKIDGSRLEVTMRKVDGRWLMAGLDPV